VEIKVGSVIGEGGFAMVYASCTKEREGKQQELHSYALKHFVLNGDQEMMRHVEKEISVLQSLSSCPHVVRMVDCCLGEKEAFILLELCGSSLADYIDDVYQKNGAMLASYSSSINEIKYKLSDGDILSFFQQIALGIKSLHSDRLVHRDIKAENILFAEGSRLVLCDFGSVSHCNKSYQSRVEVAREEDTIRKETTPAYRAPELWDFNSWSTQQRIGRPGDIFSLGCLLYLMSYGKLPFDAKNSLQILNVNYIMPKGRNAAIESLIRSMLTSDPKTRPSIDAILKTIRESNERVVDSANHVPWEANFEDSEASVTVSNIDSSQQTSLADQQCTDYEILKSHCQVVEQLLEERVKEMKILQEELREHKIQLESLKLQNANKEAMIAELQDRYQSLKHEKEKQACFGSFPINVQVSQNSVDDRYGDGDHHDLNQQDFADLDPVNRISAAR